MLRAEAETIAEVLREAGAVSPLLNVGSSTARFRTVERPWIDALVFAPLRRRGIEVDHLDLKPAPGVDLVGDILDVEVRARLARRGYRCIVVSNVLEHVPDPRGVAAACEEIAGAGGLILATVPRSYPYHADPLDTRYRPDPAQLAALFRGSAPRRAETVVGPTFAETLRSAGIQPLTEAVRTLGWLAIAPLRPRSARARLDRWRWYRRRYEVSLALLEVR